MSTARFVTTGHGTNPLFSGLLCLEFDIGRAAGEIDTGFDLRKGDVIVDVWVDVATAEATQATKTIDVGILSSEVGGDADGLADGLSIAAAGVVAGKATVTTGANTKFFASSTRGVLLEDFQAGTDVDQDEGVAYGKRHICDGTAVSLTYTLGGACTELVAKGYVLLWRSPRAS